MPVATSARQPWPPWLTLPSCVTRTEIRSSASPAGLARSSSVNERRTPDPQPAVAPAPGFRPVPSPPRMAGSRFHRGRSCRRRAWPRWRARHPPQRPLGWVHLPGTPREAAISSYPARPSPRFGRPDLLARPQLYTTCRGNPAPLNATVCDLGRNAAALEPHPLWPRPESRGRPGPPQPAQPAQPHPTTPDATGRNAPDRTRTGDLPLRRRLLLSN